MNKKYCRLGLFLLLFSLILLTLSGCGNSESKGPSKKDITKALEDTDCNIFYIEGEDIALELTSLEIILQDTEGGWSEVLAEATFENDNYKAETEMLIGLTHYDIGGWVLEAGDYTETSISVKKSPFNKKLLSTLFEEKFSDYKISNIKTEERDGEFVQTFDFSATVEDHCFPTEIYGSFTLTFDPFGNRWNKKCTVEKMNVTWDRIVGIWRYESGDDYVEIEIKEAEWLDSQHVAVSYTYETSDWAGQFEPYSPEGLRARSETFEKLETHLDSYASVEILDCTIDLPTEIYLNFVLAASNEKNHDFYYEQTVFCSWTGSVVDGSNEFKKDVDVQAALDKLNEMNGLN